MVMVAVELLVAFTVKFNVAALSHPTALVKCAVWLPAALKVKPFQEYGNKLEQMLVELVDELVGKELLYTTERILKSLVAVQDEPLL